MAKEDNWAEEYYSDQATIKKLEAEIRHQEDVVRYESDNRKTGQKALQAESKIKQLEEQIRKLKSKWKWMKDMAITKDTAEILKLSGFTVDIDLEEQAREIKKAWAKSLVKANDPVYYDGEVWSVKSLYIVWGSNPQRVMYRITSGGREKHVPAEVVSPSYQSAEKAKIEAKKPKKVKWKSVLKSNDEKPCEEKVFTKGTEDSLIGSQVFARIQGEVRKVLVLREENGRLYVKDPISGTQGWIKSEQVRDKKDSPKEELIKYAEKTKDPEYIAHVKGLKNQNTINARLQAHRQGKDGDIILPQHKCSDELLGSAKESMSQSEIDKSSWRTLNYIINHPNKFTPKTVLMAEKAIKKFEKAFTGDDNTKDYFIRTMSSSQRPEFTIVVDDDGNYYIVDKRRRQVGGPYKTNQEAIRAKQAMETKDDNATKDSIESEISRRKAKIDSLYEKADQALKAKNKEAFNTYQSQIKQEEKALNAMIRSTAHDDDATKGGAIHQYGKDLCTEDAGNKNYQIKFGRDPQGNEEAEVKLASGQTKKFRGTEAIKEAYAWIRANTKDSDHKVTEAETIINLCGGVK